MTKKLVKCEFCKTEIPLEKCEFASDSEVTDPSKHVLCCAQCAQKKNKKE